MKGKIQMEFNLKYMVVFNTIVLLSCIALIAGASIIYYYFGRKNLRLYKISKYGNGCIGYFVYTKVQSKFTLLFKCSFSFILSMVYFIIIPFYIYYMVVPAVKDIPSLMKNNYQYTVGTIYNVQEAKSSNIIFIYDLKLYEPKLFIKGKLKSGKKYRIAYLNNTKQCVGFEEVQ